MCLAKNQNQKYSGGFECFRAALHTYIQYLFGSIRENNEEILRDIGRANQIIVNLDVSVTSKECRLCDAPTEMVISILTLAEIQYRIPACDICTCVMKRIVLLVNVEPRIQAICWDHIYKISTLEGMTEKTIAEWIEYVLTQSTYSSGVSAIFLYVSFSW